MVTMDHITWKSCWHVKSPHFYLNTPSLSRSSSCSFIFMLTTKRVHKTWAFIKYTGYCSLVTLLMSIIAYWYKRYKEQKREVQLKRSNLSLLNVQCTVSNLTLLALFLIPSSFLHHLILRSATHPSQTTHPHVMVPVGVRGWWMGWCQLLAWKRRWQSL